MKIGITGHRGFIGGHIYSTLRMEQHEIIPYEENIESWGSFRSKLSPFEEFRDCDLIINLAGKNKGTDKEIISTNVFGTSNLLQWCYSNNKKVILAGTDYKHPGAYKHSRDTIKALCKSYEYINGFSSCILNMPKIIGPGCKPRYNSFVTTLVYLAAEGVLPQYLFEIKNRDEEVELLHVDDVCDTIVDLINHPFSGYTEYEFNKLDGKFSIKLGDIADILLNKNTTHPKTEMFLDLKEWYKGYEKCQK
jgi:UDP-2-acetamido-2,6-beta-L-arabino-hexul-4-ose reductase